MVSIRLSTEDYRGYESLVIRSCMMRNVNCGFGLIGYPDLQKKVAGHVGFIASRALAQERPLSPCFSAKRFADQQSHVY